MAIHISVGKKKSQHFLFFLNAWHSKHLKFKGFTSDSMFNKSLYILSAMGEGDWNKWGDKTKLNDPDLILRNDCIYKLLFLLQKV